MREKRALAATTSSTDAIDLDRDDLLQISQEGYDDESEVCLGERDQDDDSDTEDGPEMEQGDDDDTEDGPESGPRRRVRFITPDGTEFM